jgi:hypothetical protein
LLEDIVANLLVAAGQGYVKVDEDDIKKYELPKPVDYKGGKSVGTSMMHGLHCLVSLSSFSNTLI